MTPPIARRATLTKAPAGDDVVTSLTSAPARVPEPVAVVANDARAPQEPAPLRGTSAPTRRVGRPRGRRRMEPFSSKIEIGLRDQVDAYVSEHGESIVDLLDRALRAVITKQPPAGSR